MKSMSKTDLGSSGFRDSIILGCIWPGLVCMLWFLLSSYLSYWLSDYASGLERIAAMVFAGAMGFFLLF
jgi:hypothetical protein